MSSYYTATDVVTPDSFMMFPKELLKDKMTIINGDKPLLRIMDGKIYHS